MPAKKKKIVTTEIVDDEQKPEFDLASDLDTDDETLSSVLADLGNTGIKLKVAKWTEKGNEYCFTTDTANDIEDYIQQHFGGGRYSCRIFLNGDLRKVIELRVADRTVTPVPGHAITASDMQVQMLQQQTAFMQGLLQSVLKVQGNVQATPVNELADAITKLDAVRGSKSPESSNMKEMMDIFMRGIELASTLGGGGTDWKTELLRSARDIVPGILQNLPMGGNRPPQGILSPPTPQTPEQMEQVLIQKGLTFLKRKCIQNVDPGLIIDWIIANADDEQYQHFIRRALAIDFAEFAKLDADIEREPFLSWFKLLYDGLRSAFTTPDTMESDPGGSSGNVRNITDHGANGAGGSGKQSKSKGTGK